MYTPQHLGPHTFPLPGAHASHHEWLSHFKHDERRQLVEEDHHARNQAALVLFLAMGFGLICMLGTVLAVSL